MEALETNQNAVLVLSYYAVFTEFKMLKKYKMLSFT